MVDKAFVKLWPGCAYTTWYTFVRMHKTLRCSPTT